MKKPQSSVNVSQDKTDILGSAYRARTIELGEGKVCTLVSSSVSGNLEQNRTAILYLHGYRDYFFQVGLAEHFANLGYHFYALDLQGYGRSIRPNQPPTHCHSLLDYHQDIQNALALMSQDGITSCIPLAHSTGGLIMTSYLRVHQPSVKNKDKTLQIKGLILNGPFLALPISLGKERFVISLYRALANALPFVKLTSSKATNYMRSLHKTLDGEWEYRLDWKPTSGAPLSFHWLSKIMQEQSLCEKAAIEMPTLLCRSGKSTYTEKNIIECRQGDGVLNVENMESKAKATFTGLTTKVIEGGYHDLYLSPEPIRQQYLQEIGTWLAQQDETPLL